MSSSNSASKIRFEAMQVLAQCVDSPMTMQNVVMFYLTKYPHLAKYAVDGVHGFDAIAKVAAGGRSLPAFGTVRLNVPAQDGATFGWRAASYTFPAEQVREWKRIYAADRKVDAIKQCRADTGLGLKEAKDLCEYVASL